MNNLKPRIGVLAAVLISSLFVCSAVASAPVSFDEDVDVRISDGFLHFAIIIQNNLGLGINGSWNVSARRIGLDRDFRPMENGSFMIPRYMILERHFFGFGIITVINVTVDIVETKEQHVFKGYQILGFTIFF